MVTMNRFRKLRAMMGVVAALGASFLVATSVAAAGGIGGRPALPREDEPRSESIFIHSIKKGETVSDKLLVSNNTDSSQTVLIYAVDAIPSNTGAFTCKQRAEDVTDAGGWIKLARQEVMLKSGTSDIVSFTITAPKSADVGEHNACLVLESKGDTGEISGNLRIRTRSAIRVALTIPGKLHREVTIDSFGVTQDNSRQNYDIVLKNVGNVSADTDVNVRLKSLFGETVYANGGQYPVLAGNTLELSFANDKSPFFGGWFTASASVAYDKNASRWGTSTPSHLVTVYAPDRVVFIMPQPLALIIMVLVVVGVAWVLWYFITKENRRQRLLDSWRVHKVKEGETLESLADQTHGNWKQIAKINQIKAPYVLKPGQIVYIPKVRSQKASHTSR